MQRQGVYARALKRAGIVLALLLCGTAVLAGAAAVPAEAGVASITLTPDSGPQGTRVSLSGVSFPLRSKGVIYFNTSRVATFVTDGRGVFGANFTVPASPGGAIPVKAVAGKTSASRSFTVTNPVTTPAPAPTTLMGVSTPSGPYNLAELDAFERDAGKRAGVVMYFQGWAYDEFNASFAASVAARGSIPEITWEPWDYKNGVIQPAYALSRIIGGSHDAYIRRWAEGAKAHGGKLMVRFGHEMNAGHYPWSEGVNGNQAGEYIAAWKHVVDIFRAVGATNVQWVWSPNVSYEGTTPLARLYPGDSYVDWVGLDGYNGGTALPWGGWLTFAQIFGPTLDELKAITTAKPIIIAEVASVEAGGSKAQWISDFFAEMKARPEIKAFVWFNHNKEADWRIQSSETARQAFAAGVADPRFP